MINPHKPIKICNKCGFPHQCIKVWNVMSRNFDMYCQQCWKERRMRERAYVIKQR